MALQDVLAKSAVYPASIVSHRLDEPKWNLQAIQVYRARDVFNTFGENVNIAVVDTGVQRKHSEIAHSIKGGENVADIHFPDYLIDKDHHGTIVVGVIAGKRTGVAPGANVYILKQTRADGRALVPNQLAALSWCLDHDVDIINISSGYFEYSRYIDKTVERLYDQNRVIVASCGNYMTGAVFPSSFDKHVLSVSAIDRTCQHCEFSNIWPTVDISAPGKGILSSHSVSWWRDMYCVEDGTSVAAPHVTGVLALGISLLRRHGLSYTPAELEQMLKDSCLRLDEGERAPSAEALVGKYRNYYDPRGVFLRDMDVTLASVYGAGLVQAYDFLMLISKERGLKIESNL